MIILWVIKNDLVSLNMAVILPILLCFCRYFQMYSFLFFHTLFPFPLHSPPPPFLNSIAYRRVIRVYQYEVDDDLSGRSFPIFSFWLASYSPPSHLLGFFLMHLSLIPTIKALRVCVLFTNIHCDVPWGFFWDEPFRLLNPTSLALAPMLRSVNTSSHSFNVFSFHVLVVSVFFSSIWRKCSCTRFRVETVMWNCNFLYPDLNLVTSALTLLSLLIVNTPGVITALLLLTPQNFWFCTFCFLKG